MRLRRTTPGRAVRACRAAHLLCLALLAAGHGSAPCGDGLDGLRTRLRARDKWARAEAVEELARAGTPAAWELVLGALADEKGEVADTAEVVLAALEHPEALALLGGEDGLRSKEPLVRARVAELLGRTARIPGEIPLAKLLARALGDDEPEVRRMAAWSVERALVAGRLGSEARAELVDDLQKRARSDRDALVRGRALAALVRVDPGAARPALDAAWRERDPLLRGAAAAHLAAACEPGLALERLAALSADPQAAVRRVAVEALAGMETREALSVLVERMPLETEERLAARLVEQLQRLSGLKHRRDPRPWRDWLGTLPEDWKPSPAPGGPPEESGEPAERSRAALAGLPIVSKRVAILIDLSGSIWNIRADGKTRKELVDAKLREALEALPGDTRFNLIPYTGAPIPWKPRLVEASRANVRAAAAWFEARRDNGSGNLWDAALLALADPEVDTLIVLFDGAPTGGPRHRLELMIPLLLERTQARRVAFDLVLVDGTKKLRRSWSELCEGSGGRLLSVTF
ncbi:MAG TPA: HEAT repeat domain-containing protein [Planctomycetota bacterium]